MVKKEKLRKVHMPPGPELNLALSRTGYDIYQGINEIIDNSADAIKKKRHADPDYKGSIYILTRRYDPKTEGSREVIIVDTGCGASSKTDDEIAAVWGLGRSSESKHNNTSEMYGVFGIGLKASVMKLAQVATFTSRSSVEDEFKTSMYSPTHQRATGKWEIPVFDTMDQPEDTEAWAVNKYLKNSVGSVVVLRGIHDEFPNNLTAFYRSLKKSIPRIYRGDLGKGAYNFYLGTERNFHLGEKDVIDPLYSKLGIGETKWYIGDENHSETFDYKGFSYSVRVSHTEKGSAKKGESKKNNDTLGSGIKGFYKRGVYFLRNGREIGIETGDSAGYWAALASISNFFVEVDFKDDGESSSCPVQTDFGKKSVNQNSDFVAFMRRKLEGVVEKVKSYKVEKLNKTDNQKKTEFEQVIENFIKVPRKEAIKNGGTKNTSTGKKTEPGAVKNINTSRAYRGRSNKEFVVNYDDGYKSSVEICHTLCNMRKEFPCWTTTEVDGTIKIWLNEGNSLVNKLIKREITDPLQVLYLMVAPLALTAKEKLGSRPDNLQDDFMGYMGNMINQLATGVDSIEEVGAVMEEKAS